MEDKKLLDTHLKYALSINKEGDSKKHYQFLGNATYISKYDTESYVANGGNIEKYNFTYGESENFRDNKFILKFEKIIQKIKDLNETTIIKLDCEYLIATPITVDDYINLSLKDKRNKTFIACWKLPNKNTPTIYEQRLISTMSSYPIPKCRKIISIRKEKPLFGNETIPDITQKYFVETEERTYQVNEEVFAQEVYDPTKAVPPKKTIFSRFFGPRSVGPKKGGKRSKTRRTKRNRKSRFSRTKSS